MKRNIWQKQAKTVIGIMLCMSMLVQPFYVMAAPEAGTESSENMEVPETGTVSEETESAIEEITDPSSESSEEVVTDENHETGTTEIPETTDISESEETEEETDLSSESASLYGAEAPVISYQTHVQTFGWRNWSSNGEENGTTGLAKRLEAIKIQLDHAPVAGGVKYRTHVQTYDWQDWVENGAESGTTNQAKRLEAIQIELTGEMAEKYDIYYRVHCQSFGWTGWAKNGEPCGSKGYAKRLEAIRITLVEKGGPAPGTTVRPYRENLKVTYSTHVQSYGWQAATSNGESNGTTGLAKRLEGIKIYLQNHTFIEGSVEYRTHVQTYGWQGWTQEGEVAGTTGQAKRLEGIEVRLTGEMAERYDIYYRVHCQTFGWTGWGKNGEPVGSEGYGKRLEAIQITLVEKGGAAPGSTKNPYHKPELWGVDVSAHQGSINWKRAKEDGVEFAMLRITQKNTKPTGGTLMEDRYFRNNAQGALANGIPIGGYVYCYASTPAEAKAEAELAVSLLKGYQVTYPIVFDLEEEEHMTTAAKLNNMAMAKEFCSVLQAAGYKTMVYGSPSKLKRVFDYDQIASANEIWLARYRWSDDVLVFNDVAVRSMVKNTGYEGGNWTGLTNVKMWQYTERGRVDGIAGNVDLDLCYKKY